MRTLNPEGYVAVHDAARPAVSSKLIDLTLSLAHKLGAWVVPADVPSDTIYDTSSGEIVVLNRCKLREAQTPQVAPVSELLAAYQAFDGQKFTDEGSLGLMAGYRMELIVGQEDDIKLTDKGDIPLVRAVLGASGHPLL